MILTCQKCGLKGFLGDPHLLLCSKAPSKDFLMPLEAVLGRLRRVLRRPGDVFARMNKMAWLRKNRLQAN